MTLRRVVLTLVSCIFCNATLWSHAGGQTAPQTARQALLEMFFSGTPGTFAKHLPAATRTALEKSGALESMQQYSLLATQLQAQNKNFQTYGTGSVLLSAENPSTSQKFELTVENDSLQGDQDDIEISFLVYKNGQPERTPFMPRMTFSMKQEAGIWKLNEVSVTVHLPLADPDFLKGVTEGLKARAAMAAQTAVPSQTSMPMQSSPMQGSMTNYGSDASIVAAMRSILTAEATYAATYRSVGYTCTISDLDGFGATEPNEHHAMLMSSSLAGGKRFGYVFALSECGAVPATSFRLTATPNGNGFGHRAFCTDQSGVIRSSADGNPATCWTSGTPVN